MIQGIIKLRRSINIFQLIMLNIPANLLPFNGSIPEHDFSIVQSILIRTNMKILWIAAILLYIILTHIIAEYIGKKRIIGYGRSILISILFSPIIGLIVTLLSKKIQ